jgi:hypothetical protein
MHLKAVPGMLIGVDLIGNVRRRIKDAHAHRCVRRLTGITARFVRFKAGAPLAIAVNPGVLLMGDHGTIRQSVGGNDDLLG